MSLPWDGFPCVKYYEDKVFSVVVEANLEWVNTDWLGWVAKEKIPSNLPVAPSSSDVLLLLGT